jgi:hypothetical protein
MSIQPKYYASPSLPKKTIPTLQRCLALARDFQYNSNNITSNPYNESEFP